eukprot:scaffold31542_cov49-Attheya_sp.AAC.2
MPCDDAKTRTERGRGNSRGYDPILFQRARGYQQGPRTHQHATRTASLNHSLASKERNQHHITQ